ncbi:MAG: FHA domain-containing protein [Candidatus Promineofilum sp.]|nr:FHA domain-containing protein [Promineifilum sp.]
MNETDALLVVERGPVPTTRIQLQTEQLTIGRSAGNDLVLADAEVSRRHIRIVRRADGFAVEDTGSTNGTFVNGQRITHLTLLQDGDTIDLGDTVRLRYLSASEPAAANAPGPAPDLAERPTQLYSPPVSPVQAKPIQPSPHLTPPAPRPPAAAPQPAPAYTPAPSYATEEPRRGRGLLVGCGLLLALLLVCAGTFLILDAYDQGRLLYCGPLASFFEMLLGPFGFAPLCP